MEATIVDHNNAAHSFKKLVTIGRNIDDEFLGPDVKIDGIDPRVSRKHCSIVFDDWHNVYTLLNHSKNGTFVNDVLVFDEPQNLHDDDQISLNKKNPNTTFLFKSQTISH